MHIQLELMLDMSYDHHKMIEMLVQPREIKIQARGRISQDSELRAMLRAIMENPKK